VKSSDIKFNRVLIVVNSLVPLALLLWDWVHHRVGANPAEFLIRTTGVLTLVFLLLTLAVTPVRRFTKLQWLIQHRRMLGLFAFFYGCLHLLSYTGFDKAFGLGAITKDIWDRPFITVGMASFLALVPLAITSTKRMIKRLGGKRWATLHRLTYLAAVGGVVHYWMLVKSDIRVPLLFGLATAVLLGFRLIARYRPEWLERAPYQSPIPR
jgi:methionine sulfoxide reductase heme-binding subunit